MGAAALFCLVVAIADGDTLTARCGDPGAYEQVKVRLAEIDAPEKAQPFGNRSRQNLAELCFQQVATIRPTTRDRYGRTVARVECKGQDANLQQVRAGMAWAYTKYLTDPAVAREQDGARAARVGLWGDKAPLPPWDWRQLRTKGN
ncbi:thermonuclease family protein [Hydrogenophaga sp. 2FB]|uniref:thermonuclease family protein n=1 Tax=Hydrogenophaga sp. 2FB TaxID=2502187 RepID=UPI0010F7D13E|nr:thermonuclease family protein [Hydrogenophaga sp. 2FB]